MLSFFSTPESTRMQAMADDEYERRRMITVSPHWQWFEVFDKKYCLQQKKYISGISWLIRVAYPLAYPRSLSQLIPG